MASRLVAAARVRAVTFATVTSPPNNVIELASAEALAVTVEPLEAKAPDVTEPAETTEPSAGNAKLPPTPTASGGAETEAAELPPCPGTVTWIAKARAIGPGAAACPRAAEAEPTDRTSTQTPSARVVSRATPGIMKVAGEPLRYRGRASPRGENARGPPRPGPPASSGSLSAATSSATARSSCNSSARTSGSRASCSTQVSVPSAGASSRSTNSRPRRIPTRM